MQVEVLKQYLRICFLFLEKDMYFFFTFLNVLKMEM